MGREDELPSNINQTMQLTLPADHAYDVLKNMLSCSAMFMMRRWNDEERSISFSSFDDIDLVAVIHEKSESECEVRVTSDSRDANRAVRRIGDFFRDYQAQVGMTSVQLDHERRTASRRADARKEAKHGSGSVAVASELAQRVSNAPLTTKILVGFVVLFIVIGLICGITSCGASSKAANDGKIAIPESSSEFEGENYKDVVTRLESAGFTNIETEGLGDLITGFFHKDGDVKTVSVNGSTSYSSQQRFSPGAQIVIRYHSYSTSDESSSGDSDSATQKKVKAEADDAEDDFLNLPTLRGIRTIRRKPMKAIFRCRTTRNSPRYLRAEIPDRPSRVLQTSIRGAISNSMAIRHRYYRMTQTRHDSTI